MPSGGKNSKLISVGGSGTLHLGAFTLDTIIVGSDPDAPTYLTGVGLFPTSSPEIEVIDASTGLLKNNSGRSLTMQGTATYQLTKGAGGTGEMHLWSERSDDDGVTFTVNTLSLRTSEIGNNSTSSQTKSSAVDRWLPGESIRWAMYNAGAGSITLVSPSDTVNGGEAITGIAFYWQLNEV